MRSAEATFAAKIRDQLAFLHNEDYSYDQLRVFVSGIARPWIFGRDDEIEFDGDEVLVVRIGPTKVHENHDVPEFAFPLRHVVATELTASEE